jgi:hypothetical protein
MQCRRLEATEPEDGVFVLRRWADVEHLLAAAWELRRAVKHAAKIAWMKPAIDHELYAFDKKLPEFKKLRDIADLAAAADMDAPAIAPSRARMVELDSFTSETYRSIGTMIDHKHVRKAASALFNVLREHASRASR